MVKILLLSRCDDTDWRPPTIIYLEDTLYGRIHLFHTMPTIYDAGRLNAAIQQFWCESYDNQRLLWRDGSAIKRSIAAAVDEQVVDLGNSRPEEEYNNDDGTILPEDGAVASSHSSNRILTVSKGWKDLAAWKDATGRARAIQAGGQISGWADNIQLHAIHLCISRQPAFD